jgi:hypothetical protein
MRIAAQSGDATIRALPELRMLVGGTATSVAIPTRTRYTQTLSLQVGCSRTRSTRIVKHRTRE